MNFKTPFKVLTTAALIGTLSLSAVAPGAASAASTVNKVSTKAEADQPTTKIEKIIITKDNKDYTIDRVLYNQLLDANDASVKDATITAVVAADGTYYTREAYSQALAATDSVQEAFVALEEIAKTNPAVLVETIPGSIEIGEGGVEVKDPTETPDSDFKVTEIAAITTTAVEVSFPALKADVLGATVEVKDAKGTVYAVKAIDLSEGEKVATFEFEKAIDEKLFTGVWTIDGVPYDFDLINKITDIVEHDGQLDLNDALEAAEIKNVNTDLMGEYSKAIKAAETTPTTLEEIQAIVDKVNADNVSASEKEKIVEAVAAAGTNELKLYNALSANFERVNKDWIADYAAVNSEDGILFDKTESNITVTNAGELFDGVQEAIDAANLVQVATVYADAEHGLDAEKIAEAQKLVVAYKVSVEEGEDDIYALFADTLTYQSAIVTATKASTNSALLTALTKVDTLLKENTKKYAGTEFEVTEAGLAETGFKNGADKFDLKQVRTDAASLKAYRNAIKEETNEGAKNQAKDLLAIIEGVNTTIDGDAITAVTDAENADALLKALKALGLTDVVDANKNAYFAEENANFDSLIVVGKTEKEVAQQIVKDINAAEAFKTTHKAALALTEETVVAADLPALREANNAYTSLSDEAKTFVGAGVDAVYTTAKGKFVVDINLINGTGNMSEKLELLGNKYYAKLSPVQKEDVATVLIGMRPNDGFAATEGKTAFENVEAALTDAIALYKTTLAGINAAEDVEEVKTALIPLQEAGVLSETGSAFTLLATVVFEGKPAAGYASFQEILAVIK